MTESELVAYRGTVGPLSKAMPTKRSQRVRGSLKGRSSRILQRCYLMGCAHHHLFMVWIGASEQGGKRFAFVKKLGLRELSLHVFAHNTVARALYEKTGFEVTDLQMTKRLSD